ncbi:prepilin-type N-terminal cleavage/methylation domain-containing protein [Rhodopseudomonas palustris]|uniref:Methylation n=1 Tax=Rhodopseudomonas palustris (strain BisB18) TaxID=316056 RepID=Q212Y6_RHOPB
MSRRIRSEQRGEDGFTMIEAVVALALVAVVLAAIGSLVATNARGVRNLEQHVTLAQIARMVANTIPRYGDALPDELAGETSGYRWQMRASPLLDAAAVPGSRFIAQRVELRVKSPSGAMVSLETVRLQNRSELR